MKVCGKCGAMISPHPMHRNTTGICAECYNDNLRMFAGAMGMTKIPDHLLEVDEVDNGRPKMRGKHMVMRKSSEQAAIEQRQKDRRIVRY